MPHPARRERRLAAKQSARIVEARGEEQRNEPQHRSTAQVKPLQQGKFRGMSSLILPSFGIHEGFVELEYDPSTCCLALSHSIPLRRQLQNTPH